MSFVLTESVCLGLLEDNVQGLYQELGLSWENLPSTKSISIFVDPMGEGH